MSGSRVSTKPPSGFRDFLGLEASRRAELAEKIADCYEAFGFERLETSALENLEVLQGSGGQENEKLIFKALKRGEKFEKALQVGKSESDFADLGLRFDLTVPLCRVVGQYQNEIKFPWKVFHIGPVWRAERPQKGRYREFFQCDVDIVGSSSRVAELDVIEAVSSGFSRLGVQGLQLILNDRRIINGVAEKFGFTGKKLGEFAVILDKQDKIPKEKMMAELEEVRGSNLPMELLEMLEGKVDLSALKPIAPEAVENLSQLLKSLSEIDLIFSDIRFDLSLIRGMGYYTSTVFEVKQEGESYALGGGGRYDDLLGRFLKAPLPAVGMSIGFERLLLVLESLRASERKQDRIFMPVFEEGLRSASIRLAGDLRLKGIKVDLYPDEAKVKAQFKFASSKGYRFALIAGEDEFTSKTFKIKDFENGQEEEVTEGDLATQVIKILRDS